MDFLARRLAIMRHHTVSSVLDVGANTGQFALQLRALGYMGRIVSFEPLHDAFRELTSNAAPDPLWECHNVGLADTNRVAVINVSENSYSSSLLPVSPVSLVIEPSIGYVRTEAITLRRLDDMFDQVCRPTDTVYLKIDTQGYELPVINGALASLRRIKLVQLETSFYPVYVGERLAGEMIGFLGQLGFRVVSVEPGWEDPVTAELLQADVILVRDAEPAGR
jgi:FkbM family methyltransferase